MTTQTPSAAGGSAIGGPLAAALAEVAGCRAPFFIGAGSAVIAAGWLRHHAA